MDVFEQLLEDDEFIQKQIAKGRAIGTEEGEMLTLQRLLVKVASQRFPSLEGLAQKRAESTKQLDVLNEITLLVGIAPDEATARFLLTPWPGDI